MPRPTWARLVPALALLLALTACQSSTGGSASSSTGDPASSSTGDLTMTDPWVKAADTGMTAAFGTLTNTTDHTVTLVSATSAVSPMELHEVVADASGATVMQPKAGGFVIPAGGSLVLAPGGEHLMFMTLSGPLAPGDDVTFTVASDDGGTWTFSAPVRTFTGAKEDYQSGDSMSGTSDSGSPMPTATP